jgi:hypothetical protein
MRALFQILILSFTILLLSSSAQAQQIQGKHPRVAELENALIKDSSEFLKGRFPDVPFSVSAQIEPLRRPGAREGSQAAGESLPYLELQDEEIRDEWDDPSIPLRALILRAKKASLKISVPSSLAEEEIEEIKQSVMNILNLVPVRDEIIVQKRAWTMDKSGLPVYFLPGVGALLLLSLFGLFMISRGSVNKLVKSLENSRQSSSPAPAPMASSSPRNDRDDQISKTLNSGDLKFSDPFKTREMIKQSITLISSAKAFPTLQDMLVLDGFGKRSPSALGALLTEFPKDIQKRIFSYSSGDYWLEAFNEPGELSGEALQILQKLLRHKHEEATQNWEEMLLLVWRLNDSRNQFFRTLEEGEALSVLHRLPKSISITTARAVFPCNWGALLKPDFKPNELDDLRIHAITKQALALLPLRDIALLETYRHDRDLLDYLKVAEPSEEREIYIASPRDSLIHSVRPPFFKIFELDEQSIDFLVERLPVEDWSMAMFNLGKTERREIEARFPEKKKFMYIERLKQLDANPPEKTRIGGIREKIARIIDIEISKRTSIPSTNTGETVEESRAA